MKLTSAILISSAALVATEAKPLAEPQWQALAEPLLGSLLPSLTGGGGGSGGGGGGGIPNITGPSLKLGGSANSSADQHNTNTFAPGGVSGLGGDTYNSPVFGDSTSTVTSAANVPAPQVPSAVERNSMRRVRRPRRYRRRDILDDDVYFPLLQRALDALDQHERLSTLRRRSASPEPFLDTSSTTTTNSNTQNTANTNVNASRTNTQANNNSNQGNNQANNSNQGNDTRNQSNQGNDSRNQSNQGNDSSNNANQGNDTRNQSNQGNDTRNQSNQGNDSRNQSNQGNDSSSRQYSNYNGGSGNQQDSHAINIQTGSSQPAGPDPYQMQQMMMLQQQVSSLGQVLSADQEQKRVQRAVLADRKRRTTIPLMADPYSR